MSSTAQNMIDAIKKAEALMEREREPRQWFLISPGGRVFSAATESEVIRLMARHLADKGFTW